MARPLILLVCVLLSACQRWPDSYPAPEQSPPVEAPPFAAPAIIALRGPDVDEHIVRDVWLGASPIPWRWTGKQPLLKLQLHSSVGRKFVSDYTVPEATFKYTGPVRISFFANGHLLDTVRVAKPGSGYFEKPVPENWLHPGAENTVGAEIDKVWIDPHNGARYGFILSSIGFAPTTPKLNSNAAGPS
ncbi:MAG TPA: hypothetical protein VKV15_09160 [Bryobacteraceae bacterium]|nr:hypothetical protein [Bryobacteraceae bacterium]